MVRVGPSAAHELWAQSAYRVAADSQSPQRGNEAGTMQRGVREFRALLRGGRREEHSSVSRGCLGPGDRELSPNSSSTTLQPEPQPPQSCQTCFLRQSLPLTACSVGRQVFRPVFLACVIQETSPGDSLMGLPSAPLACSHIHSGGKEASLGPGAAPVPPIQLPTRVRAETNTSAHFPTCISKRC